MLSKEFYNEKQKTDDVYKEVVQIADDIVKKASEPIDKIINKLKNGFEDMSNRQLNDFMLQLSIEAYYFGIKKDHALLKQVCADALYKESFAKSFSISQGTQANRQNQAAMDTTDKQTVKMLYECTSNQMKTKLDETHRMINALNSAVISRNAEAKLNVKDENVY